MIKVSDIYSTPSGDRTCIVMAVDDKKMLVEVEFSDILHYNERKTYSFNDFLSQFNKIDWSTNIFISSPKFKEESEAIHKIKSILNKMENL